MRCEQARQLFDAYLDGELSSALATELGAHRLRCPECRQALALLEVSGHIMRTDREPVQLRRNFTERLVACMSDRPERLVPRFKRGLYIAGPLAAAAVIALAFLGAFDRQAEKVAGTKEVLIERADSISSGSTDHSPAESTIPGAAVSKSTESQARLQEWIEQTRRNITAKRQSGEVLRQYFDQTITEWNDILDPAKNGSIENGGVPGSETPTSSGRHDDASSSDDDSVDRK